MQLKIILITIILFPWLLSAQEIDIKSATGYPPLEKHTNSEPFITASGVRVHKCGIAIDRYLVHKGLFMGCRVQITGINDHRIRLDGTSYCGGLYVVNDKMGNKLDKKTGFPVNHDSIDLLFFRLSDARRFGRQRDNIKLKILWCE